MSIAALVTWLITAGFGSFMLIRWATSGGLRQVPGAGTNFHEFACSRILAWPPPA